MSSTGDELKTQLSAVRAAETALANADMELTGDPAEDFESWEEMYTAASAMEDAAEELMSAASQKMKAAEQAADDAAGDDA